MTLLKGGTILFAASMAGAVCNYLFQFYMSRHLSIADYGVMNSVFSMLIIAGVPTGTIMLVVAKYASAYCAKKEAWKITELYRSSLFKMALLGAAIFASAFMLKDAISGFMHIEATAPVVIIEAGVFVSFIVTVNLGMLQGLKSFYWFASALFLLGALKLASGAALVFFGYGVDGAIASAVLATLIVTALTAFPLISFLKKKTTSEKKEYASGVAAYSAPVFIASVIFAVLTNIDLIMVRHVFSPEEAGMYSAVSVLGKTILYLPASFVLALFPMVSEADTLNTDSFRLLDRGLIYTAGFSFFGVAAFTLFPGFFLGVLFGPAFGAAAPLLKFYSAAMLCMAVVSVIMSFSLARRRYGFIYPLGAASLLLVLTIEFYHPSLEIVAMTLALCSFIAAGLSALLVYRERRLFYVKTSKSLRAAELG